FFTEAGLYMVFMVAFRQKLVRPQPVGAGAARCVDSAFRPTRSALSRGLAVLVNEFGVIYLFRLVHVFASQGYDHLVNLSGEGEVILGLVVVRYGRAVVDADIEGFAEREGSAHRFINGSLRHLLAVYVQLAGAFEHPGFDEVKLEVHLPLGQHGRDDRVSLGVNVVVVVMQLVVGNKQGVTAIDTATRDDDALFVTFQVERSLDGVRLVLGRCRNGLGNTLGPRRIISEALPITKHAAELLGDPGTHIIVEWIDVVLLGLLVP